MTIGAVVIGRNDGYGGDTAAKALYALTSLIHALDEVIFVDWNSPNDEPLFEDILPQLPKTGKLRCIAITQAMHTELTGGAEAQKCVEVLARNIGIRRLKTDWSISTNQDVMVVDRWSIERALRGEDTFHCVPRRDMDFPHFRRVAPPGNPALQEYLRVGIKIGKLVQAQDGSPLGSDDPWSLITCPGDFQLAHRDLWHAIRGFEESLIKRGYTDSNVQKKAALAGYRLELVRDIPVFHFCHYPDTGSCGGAFGAWNDQRASLQDFTQTTNPETWGFSDREFPTIQI